MNAFVRIGFGCMVILFFGCAKDSDADANKNEKEVVLINGVPYESLSSTNIDFGADSLNWISSTGGRLYIDSTSHVGDSINLFMTATDGCFMAEQKKGVPFVLEQQSAIQFSYELPETRLNDIRDGNGYTCAGACRMEIFQGDELLLSEWIREADQWTDVQYLFRTKRTDEVKIRFVVGSKKGFWLDDIKLLQKL